MDFDPDPMTGTLPLDAMICFALYGAERAMTRTYQPLLAPLGLTYPQYLALLALWQKDGLTVGEIGATLGLETNTLTPLLKRLEAAGLVTRSRDKRDERQVLIALTGAGREMERRTRHIPGCIAEATGFGATDAIALRDALIRLKRNLAEDKAS